MSTGADRGFTGVPEWQSDAAAHRRKLAQAINRINSGKVNCTLAVTLQAGATATTVQDPRIGPASFLLWMPQTASASAAERAGIYVTGRAKGSAVLNHAASGATDQIMTLVILG
ncbi:MAG TPA: hypothetical protein VFA50_13200 [Stellaceae bacterium]|nr:hypothetical protein [Stellaceae bacterium]